MSRPAGEVEIHLLDLDLSASPSDSSLSADERARAAAFRIGTDRARFVAARAALRAVLGQALGLDVRAVPLETSPLGQPRLAAPHHDLAFNLTHAGDRAGLALARAEAVGIDLEPQGDLTIVELDRVAAQLFHPAERTALAALATEDYRSAWFRVWTRREAVLKALGLGLSAPAQHLAVGTEAGHWTLRLGGRPARDWLTQDLPAPPGWSAALAVPGGRGMRVRLRQSFRDTPPDPVDGVGRGVGERS